MKKMQLKRALFVGRFQPFHLGHLTAVKQALKENDELVIVIGSAQENYTKDNPFTVGDRLEMIANTMQHEGLRGRIFIIPVPDTQEAVLWAKRVLSYSPKLSGPAYSNNAWTKMLLEKEGLTVKPISEIKGISGTKIRELMRQGGEWKKLVPKKVAEFIEKNGLEKTVKELSKL